MRVYKIPAKLKKPETYITVDGKPHQIKMFCGIAKTTLRSFDCPTAFASRVSPTQSETV